MRIDRSLVGILVALALAGSARAQGLGDAATRESERRKAAQQKAGPVKSYTDQDLPSSQIVSPVAEEAPEDTAEAGQEAEGTPQGGGTVISGLPVASDRRTVKSGSSGSSPRTRDSSASESESYGQNPGSEAGWRAAASGARRRIAAAQARVQELDKKAAGLLYAPPGGGCNVGSADKHMTREELKKFQCPDAYLQWQKRAKAHPRRPGPGQGRRGEGAQGPGRVGGVRAPAGRPARLASRVTALGQREAGGKPAWSASPSRVE